MSVKHICDFPGCEVQGRSDPTRGTEAAPRSIFLERRSGMKEEPSTMTPLPSKTEHELEELLRPLRRRAVDEGWNEDYRGGINDVLREVDRALPALLAERKRLREGLLELVRWDTNDGPCWCQVTPVGNFAYEGHESQCRTVRSLLAEAEPSVIEEEQEA